MAKRGRGDRGDYGTRLGAGVILRSLAMENFGLYGGRQELDLTPSPGKPVILIGGTNGAGKTTLLEAILLCLHGRRSLWPLISQAEYHRRVSLRMHTPIDGSPVTRTSVELRLDHTEGGRVRSYRVRRSWRRTRGGAVREELELDRDQEPVSDVTGHVRQEFLDSLVPPALAGLFFFDGEKIQDLADDDPSGALRDAVRRLLGLDLLDRLATDLTRYVVREASDTGHATLQAAATEALSVRSDAVEQLEAARENARQLFEDRAGVEARLTRAEGRFAAEGGSLAAERGRLQEQLAHAAQAVEAGSAQIQEMIAGLLPLAICHSLAAKLEAQLNADEKAHADALIRERLAASTSELTRAFRAVGGGDVVSALSDLLLPDGAATHARHDLSPGTRGRMLAELAQIRGAVPQRALRTAAEVREARSAAEPLREALEMAPDDDAVAPALSELQDLGRRRGRLDERLAAAEDDCRHREHVLRVADRNLRRANERLAAAEGLSERATRAARAAGVLERFEEQAGARRMNEVQLLTARFFNRLVRKPDLIAEVNIDPDTFKVSLKRWDGTTLVKAQLSAGERQLLAIALLWALASVSQRALPVVIDTPLARLDRDHRRGLLREYFPVVSEQVVVLSTDTEVDGPALESLRGSVARSYRLQHHADRCATTVEPGYLEVDETGAAV